MRKTRLLISIIIILCIVAIPIISTGNVNNNNVEVLEASANINIENESIEINKKEENNTQLKDEENKENKKTTIEQKQLKDNLLKKEEVEKLNYQFKTIEKYENALVYKIKYPVFNNDNINEKINEHISYLSNSFKQDFEGYEPMSEDDKVIFNLNTDVNIFKEKLLFIKFSIERNYNTYPNPVKFYETYIIDIEDNKQIEISEFLNKGYEDLFYIKAKEYFLNNYGLTITKQSENYNDIKPDKEIYKKIYLSNENLEVFIYDYKKQEEVILNIPIDNFMPYVKEEYASEPTTTETTTLSTTLTTEATTETTTLSTETSTQATTQKTEDTNNTNRKIDKTKPMIALTFDDGPNSATTNRILDILEENNSVATFFVVSRRIEKDTETLKRMDSLGNQIGNHTANHKDLTKISSEQIKTEVDIVNDKLKKAIGKEASIVRAPYGATNDNVKASVEYPLIMWNVDTKDWKSKDAKAIEKEVLGKVKDGDIVLMHDLYGSTADACEVIIPKLIEQGYQLVTVEELFYYKGIELKNGNKYFNANAK